MSNNKHVILDLETLGTADNGLSNSAVVSMAAIVFDEDIEYDKLKRVPFERVVDSTFYVKFALDTQKKGQRFERTIDPKTVQWWSEQEPAVRSALKPSDEDEQLNVAMFKFKSFLNEKGCNPKTSKIYCRGQHFDIPILQNIMHGLDMSFHEDVSRYWNWRDLRTALDELVGSDSFKLPNAIESKFIKHDARADVAHELFMLVFARALSSGETTFEEMYKDDISND